MIPFDFDAFPPISVPVTFDTETPVSFVADAKGMSNQIWAFYVRLVPQPTNVDLRIQAARGEMDASGRFFYQVKGIFR